MSIVQHADVLHSTVEIILIHGHTNTAVLNDSLIIKKTSDELYAINKAAQILMSDLQGTGRQCIKLFGHVGTTNFHIINLDTKQSK